MELLKALKRMKELESERIKNLKGVKESLLKGIEGMMQGSGVEVHNFDRKEVQEVSLGAVDSAFAPISEDFFGRTLYGIATTGIYYLKPKKLEEAGSVDIEQELSLSEETEELASYLSSYGLCREILLAGNLLKEKGIELVLFDGSVVTFITKINQACMFSKAHPDMNLSKWMRESYGRILETFSEIVINGKAFFLPKRSKRKEFLSYIGLGEEPYTDMEALHFVLGKGQFVVVPISQYKYNLPKAEGIDTKTLFEVINSGKVLYYKNFTGRTTKVEYFSEVNPLAFIHPLLKTEGENLLVLLADRKSKEKIRVLIKSSSFNKIAKYRI